MGLSSNRRRRRRAVDGEQLLAFGAAAVPDALGMMQEWAVQEPCTPFEVMPPTTRRQSGPLAPFQMRLVDLFLR